MSDLKKRLKDLRKELDRRSLESLLVTNESNVRYLSGFKGSDSLLFITPDSQFFLTDSRYTQEAKDSVRGFTILEVTSSTYDAISTMARKGRIKKIGFEAMNLPFGIVEHLGKHIGRARLVPTKGITERLRAIKDAEEIGLIKKSLAVTKSSLKRVMKDVKPGVSELGIASLIEFEFIKNDAKSGFDTIVACGSNSAKPHAHPSQRKIAKNDTVMIDMGCSLDFYNSDITRMALIGKVPAKVKEIYSIVKRAQDKALEAIAPGRKISDIDHAGRQCIADEGYGKFFGHSLGHGVGLDVHEEPSISGRSTDTLKPGMVFTVEPAIYIPGAFGVRIEDMVLVTSNGFEILSR